MATTTNDTGRSADDGVHFGKLALIFVIFAALFLLTALVMDFSSQTIERQVMASETVAPIITTDENTVLYISIENRNLSESWAFVEAELVDRQGRWVGGFGGNQYHESGYDSDGYYSEGQTVVDLTLVVPQPGEYALRFKVEGGRNTSTSSGDISSRTPLTVRIDYKLGGGGIFFALGLIILVIGVVLNEIRNRTLMSMIFK